MRSVSAALRTVTGKWCRECGRPKNGPTSELLAWAKAVGRQEVIRELADAMRAHGINEAVVEQITKTARD